MARRRKYDLEIPTWKCPHCGFVHTAADLLRADGINLLCKNCGKTWNPGKKE